MKNTNDGITKTTEYEVGDEIKFYHIGAKLKGTIQKIHKDGMLDVLCMAWHVIDGDVLEVHFEDVITAPYGK